MPHVCETCVEDDALQEVVRENAIAQACDYCGAMSDDAIAAEVCEIAWFILSAVEKEFVDPANELPYETREGGYQGRVIDDPNDLLEEIGFSLQNDDLFVDITKCLAGDVWLCRRDYYSCTPSERLQFGWSGFKHVVKHQRRYTFWTAVDEQEAHVDHLPTARMLAELADIIIRVGLIKKLPIDVQMWRTRVHDATKTYKSALDFSSPPLEAARYSNRMSPAGVPMFYGAEDFETAVIESVDPKGKDKGRIATGAAFTPIMPLNILDLVGLPEAPSFFSDNDDLRHAIYFLRHFTRDLSQPIEKDGREHIEYVPTQVLTEFVRHEVKSLEGDRIHGIKFSSSRNRRTCYVIFAEQDDCLDSVDWRRSPQILRFVDGSIQSQKIN